MRAILGLFLCSTTAVAQVASPSEAALYWSVMETAAAIKKCPKDFRVKLEYRDVFKFKMMDFYRLDGIERTEKDVGRIWQPYSCPALRQHVIENQSKFVFLQVAK